MPKTIVLVASLDTKGAELSFVKEIIRKEGINTLVVDFGVLGRPGFAPDIDRKIVAEAGGRTIEHLSSGERKDEAMRVMADGLAAIVANLYEDRRLDGILGMGGTGGTSIATTAMRALPVGVPKVMISTVGGGDVSAYAGTRDITFVPSIVDVAGLNRISRRIYANGAGAIVGMVKQEVAPPGTEEKPLIAASMFGNTTKSVDNARGILTGAGYEVLVFHATGTGGRTMEDLIADNYFRALLDITTTELADYVCGGVFDAGPARCQAAGRAGIPVVMVPGCVDMANFGAPATVPERYRGRRLYEWNANVTLLRTDIDENVKIGLMIAAAANSAKGPVAIVIPLRGVSMLDSEGGKFWDPDADNACFETIRSNVRSGVRVIELDLNINDVKFSTAAANELLAMLSG